MSDVPGKTYFSRLVGRTGFKADSLEKVYRLMMILDRMQTVPELSNNLALKGGTAIQGMVFGFKRLSVDIDLNYIGDIDRTIMQKDRAEIRRSLLLLFKDLGYKADAPVSMYAEEQFDIHFRNCGGGADHLKLEINYLERMPVAGTIEGELKHPFEDLGSVKAITYRPEELFAGKMRALIIRGTPRDIYDANMIFSTVQAIDSSLFRKLVLFYLSMYGDARSMGTGAVESVTEKDMLNNLVPMLPRTSSIDAVALRGDALSFARDLLTLSQREKDFFQAMYSEKRIDQNLLFEHLQVHKALHLHPSIVWKLRSIKP
ncbi:MAG TPA: nucleotidyl transferase AbiEii/AbiGii toxin family protein [Methanomassiliicoccales archaeon]|nr:nucleotidyl transferase AbiEii/AbiGii toxin family protein [Methanomassiliicoccales archaeon]HPR99068.1 nucleotidyl transferase AbiEii/AbiGii toxin family protein [Methanomassiliicoccales archaeon]HSA35132.1 nucleotidyl transferase AbiEii/AbiGii toxin family protein [Methanomassiliicoccales archaeon]